MIYLLDANVFIQAKESAGFSATTRRKAFDVDVKEGSCSFGHFRRPAFCIENGTEAQ